MATIAATESIGTGVKRDAPGRRHTPADLTSSGREVISQPWMSNQPAGQTSLHSVGQSC